MRSRVLLYDLEYFEYSFLEHFSVSVTITITKQHYSQKHTVIRRSHKLFMISKSLKILTTSATKKKKAVLRFCIMNDKKRFLILLKFLDQIRQDNEEARIERSITTICKEEGISFEQVLYIYIIYIYV